MEAYSCRPKFSKYGGVIWLERNDEVTRIKCIEYGGIKLNADDKGEYWNILKFILRSSAVCYITLLNLVSNEFLDKLLFITFSFSKDSWKLLLEDLVKKDKIPNNMNISYYVNPNFAASRFYFNGKTIRVSKQGQPLLLFSKYILIFEYNIQKSAARSY